EGGRAGPERQRDARHEVVDVAPPEHDVSERSDPPAPAPAQQVRYPARAAERDQERGEEVEQRAVVGRNVLVAGDRHRHGLGGRLGGRLQHPVRLQRQRRGAAPPDTTELARDGHGGGDQREAAEHLGAPLDPPAANAPAHTPGAWPHRHRSISSSSDTCRTSRAGEPITRARAGTSRVTTDPAATNASSPTSTPGNSTDAEPTRHARRRRAPRSSKPAACRPIVLSLVVVTQGATKTSSSITLKAVM